MVRSYRYSANSFPQKLREEWVARSLFPNRNSYQIVTSQRNIKKRNQLTGFQKISLNSIDQKSVIYKFLFHISFAIVLLTYTIGLLFFFKYIFEAQVISKQYLLFSLVNYKKLIYHFTHENCRKKYFLGTIPQIYNIDIIFRTFFVFFVFFVALLFYTRELFQELYQEMLLNHFAGFSNNLCEILFFIPTKIQQKADFCTYSYKWSS